MSHREWMKLTYGGRTAVRSSKLRAVDSALARYHRDGGSPASKRALEAALMAWMTSKGAGWQTSVRNKHNAVDTLYRQLTGMGGARPPAPGNAQTEAAARQALSDEAHELLAVLFRGAQVTWKSEFAGKLGRHLVDPTHDDFLVRVIGRQAKTSAANNKYGLALNTAGAAKNARDLHRYANTGQTNQAMGNLLSTVVPAGAQAEVLKAVATLVPGFAGEFAASVAPISGLLTAAGGTVYNSFQAARKQYGLREARIHASSERSLAGEEASAAFDALIRILVRERDADIFSAGVSLTEFGGKLAGMALDGGLATGPAVGLAANLVKLMNIARMVYRDISEKNAANAAMRGEAVDLTIFETCPLVGCYLICCAPTSVLTSLVLERLGERGWMDVTERATKRHIEPLRREAKKVIKDHRFEIASLRGAQNRNGDHPATAGFPGLLDVNTAELDRMKSRVGRGPLTGFGPEGYAALQRPRR